MFLTLLRLFIAALWSPAGKGLTSWLLLVMFIVFFFTFLCGILGQVYLSVSFPDTCLLSYFLLFNKPFFCCIFQSLILDTRNKLSNQIEDAITHLRSGYPHFNTTVKPVLSGHSKTDKTKVLKTNGSLMKVESIAECILQYFRPAFSDNRS